jgi:acylphosphatase
MTMMVSKQIFISGNVQGVFFRESTRQIAGELMLSGFVRNLRDGRVEVHATGDESSIQSLIKWLKIGPKLAKVSTIRVLEIEISPDLLSQQKIGHFEIWPTT